LGKSRLRDKSEYIPEPAKFFHWYDEGRLSCLEVHGEGLRIFLIPFLSKDLGIPATKKQREKFLRLRREAKAIVRIRVVTLLEACELLGISPGVSERMKPFRRDYPISLGKPQIYNLMTHLINEGNVVKRNPRGYYSNLDMSLHDRVAELVKSLGGYWSRRMGKDNVPETCIGAAVIKLLTKAGMVPGKKTQGQYYRHLPKQILDYPELNRYHISATIAEEGWPSLILKVGSKPRIMMGYSRSIDVTDILPKEYVLSLEIGKKLSPGYIPNEIKSIIQAQPFPFLDDEITIIEKELHIETQVNLTGLYKSKKERITVEWRVTWEGPESVKKYEDNFGFLAGSKVERRFKLVWRLYEEYRDRPLNRDVWDYIERQLASV